LDAPRLINQEQTLNHSSDAHPAKIRLFGIDLDPVRLGDAVRTIMSMARDGGPCRYVVTPNVDHVLIFQRTEGLRRAYADASLIVVDGLPIVMAARLFGLHIPERVTGADLVPAVFDAATEAEPLRVFLLGAGPGVAERAKERMAITWKGVNVVGTYSPPFGFERDAAENDRILEKLNEARPHVLIVGLGAPKQEMWVHAHRDRIAAPVALCVGAAIDFLAGERSRAPAWMQRRGLEWFHRMTTEPRRLVPRYATNVVGFPLLVLKEWRDAKRA
jgi:N-acetylglucosaminyldiphosphoundecaprenol N-acetyl-beta-D-mannosaminyltransferase